MANRERCWTAVCIVLDGDTMQGYVKEASEDVSIETMFGYNVQAKYGSDIVLWTSYV